MGVGALVLAGLALWAGYQMGVRANLPQMAEDGGNAALHNLLVAQRKELSETRESTEEHLDALALRLGKMQSRILRIDALGERLAELSKLDVEEFSFGQEPAVGGLYSNESAESIELNDLVADMESLARTIEDREHKLDLMEGLLLNDKMIYELKPSGRPVKKSWISSRYGYRKDPFTGKRVFHRGVDVASKKDAEVIAVASGIVTWAGKKRNYGFLIELRHADGYVTRYGHNSKIFVEVGDMVTKGEVIGLVGSTGRSTGPHVHFEVVRNGKSLNPAKYLRAK